MEERLRRIVTAFAERIASHNTPCTFEHALNESIFLNGFQGVGRATGMVFATGAQQGADSTLVEANCLNRCCHKYSI